MSKDPAILFYYDDYLSGTEDMTFEEQGAYMRLLCKQAAKGRLPDSLIRKVLKKEYSRLWPTLSEKFNIDDDGLFYNERLEKERLKREAFIAKQKLNGVRGGRPKSQPETQQQPKNNPSLSFGLTQTKPIVGDGNGNEKNNQGEAQDEVVVQHAGLVPDMVTVFLEQFPAYPPDPNNDFPACLQIARRIGISRKWTEQQLLIEKRQEALQCWREVVAFVAADAWYSKQSISMLARKWQDLIQAKNGQKMEPAAKTGSFVGDQIRAAREKNKTA